MPFPILSAPPEERRSRKSPDRSNPRRRVPARRRGTRALRFVLWAVLIALLLPVPVVIVYRFVPPPITALMAIRSLAGAPLHQHWVSLDRIAPAMVRAVVASEDEKFCFHHGFDWQALDNAWRDWRAGREPKGASTISMQTAKNLFLWPGRSLLRKGIEAYLTVLIEFFWDKHRIIETYLNVIEWGNGVYGAETAAEHYFGTPAAALSPQEAALLAAVLPDPRAWSPIQPTPYIAERAAIIRERMAEVTVPNAATCR
jgi:monofunctional biosynthetic peptidoglycan transglycosylase